MFIRFGKIPTDGLSTIHYRGYDLGKEIGLSVYNCAFINDKYHIILPVPCSSGTIHSLEGFILYNNHKKVYLVDGDIVGYGTDGEPLIANVKIVDDITDKFFKDIYVDEDALHEKLISKIPNIGEILNE